ncbi:hypothetical protein ACWELO_09930 [Streptomyces sp. NPDC004596]
MEPELRESMKALEEKLVSEQNQDESEAQTASQGLRAIGRQISEALRAAVIEGMRVRERHLAQLVVIDRAAAQSANITRLQERIGTEIERAGLRRIAETSDLSLFNLAGATEPAAGDSAYELVTPAYVDMDTGRVVERGWLRPMPQPGSSLPQGKSHGRVSRENKSRNNNKGSGAERHPSDDAVRPEGGAQHVGEQTSSRASGDSGSAEKAGSAPQRTTKADRGRGGEAKGRNASAREATRVASSYFVKRMLGGTAGQEKLPRRSS